MSSRRTDFCLLGSLPHRKSIAKYHSSMHNSKLSIFIIPALLLGCSTGPAEDLGELISEIDGSNTVSSCDPEQPHQKGDFLFDPKVDSSLPGEWAAEFDLIMANLGDLMPISPCIHEVPSANSPMTIYAWNGEVSNPFPERPDMSGASISGDGTDLWMVLEINPDEFEYDSLHRYSVIVHEYFHVYQIALSGDLTFPIWLWEGGAKVTEELYIQQQYGRSEFDNKLFPVSAEAVIQPELFEEYVGGEIDNNYNGSAFLLLALVRELQEQQNLSEEQAFTKALIDFQKAKLSERDWRVAFSNVFGMEVEDFYSSLEKYSDSITPSPEEWIDGDVIDPQGVIPSKGLRLEDIFLTG